MPARIRASLPTVVAGLLALALIGGGGWTLAAEIARAPASSVVGALERGEQPEGEALDQAAAALGTAAAIRGDADYYAELGLVRLTAWQQAAAEERTAAGLRRARRAIVAGLAEAPAEPYGWTRLAEVRYYLADTRTPAVLDALELSALTGPHVEALHLTRAELVLRLWPAIDAGDRGWAERALRRAAAHRPDRVQQIAERTGRTAALVSALPVDSPLRDRLVPAGEGD